MPSQQEQNKPFKQEGRGPEARFGWLWGVVCDEHGNAYVTDSLKFCVWRVTPDGQSSVLAGCPGTGGFREGKGREALFTLPKGVGIDEEGNLVVCDAFNHVVRVISTTDGTTRLLAGIPKQSGAACDGRALGQATFYHPEGVCFQPNGDVLVADSSNHCIRVIEFVWERFVLFLLGRHGNAGRHSSVRWLCDDVVWMVWGCLV